MFATHVRDKFSRLDGLAPSASDNKITVDMKNKVQMEGKIMIMKRNGDGLDICHANLRGTSSS